MTTAGHQPAAAWRWQVASLRATLARLAAPSLDGPAVADLLDPLAHGGALSALPIWQPPLQTFDPLRLPSSAEVPVTSEEAVPGTSERVRKAVPGTSVAVPGTSAGAAVTTVPGTSAGTAARASSTVPVTSSEAVPGTSAGASSRVPGTSAGAVPVTSVGTSATVPGTSTRAPRSDSATAGAGAPVISFRRRGQPRRPRDGEPVVAPATTGGAPPADAAVDRTRPCADPPPVDGGPSPAVGMALLAQLAARLRVRGRADVSPAAASLRPGHGAPRGLRRLPAAGQVAPGARTTAMSPAADLAAADPAAADDPSAGPGWPATVGRTAPPPPVSVGHDDDRRAPAVLPSPSPWSPPLEAGLSRPLLAFPLDAADLADLVNDALAEQARRHGVELP